MRTRWHIGGSALVVALVVGFALPSTVAVMELSLPEADALAAGSQLAAGLSAEGALKGRLKEGFRGVPRHPRVRALKRHPAMARSVEPPLPRWLTGLAIAKIGRGADASEWNDLDRSRFAAAFALGVALAMVFALVALLAVTRGSRAVSTNRSLTALASGGLAVVVALSLPGVVEAGTAAGYAATLALASAALVWGTVHAARGGSGLWAGGAWGLSLACHPGALFLIVPVMAAIAIGRRAPQATGRPVGSPAEPAPGHLSLPTVALTALGVPLVGALTLVALWPSLWSETTTGLATWLSDLYRVVEPSQVVAGFGFGQLDNKPPSGWAALVQFVGWVPLPLLLAWFVGVIAAVKKGANGLWAPILIVVTILLVGAGAGGLFAGRMSLLPLLWPPVALTAVVGIGGLIELLVSLRPSLPRAAAGIVIIAAITLTSAVVTVGGFYPLGGPNGSDALQPLPVEMLEAIAEDTPEATVAVVGGGASWRRTIEIMTLHGGLQIKALDDASQADWVVMVDEPTVVAASRTNVFKDLPQSEPVYRGSAGGLGFKAYQR